jgi:LPS sulfotransferase NodH
VPAVPDAYLICATPRTGSTLLCALLRSTGVAGRPESYFRVPDEPRWAERWQLPRDPAGSFDYLGYVRAALAAGTTPNGVFGARVMWGTLEQVVARARGACPDLPGTDLDLLTNAFGRTRFIHLRRNDTVAQAVSWARAEQTGYWQPGDPAPAREPRFDHHQIDGLMGTIEEHNGGWRDWFAAHDVQPYLLRYEDLAADPLGATRAVLDYLGLRLPTGRVITAPHRRQADRVNQDWTIRYSALRS